jgi:hypothetical protein
MFASADRAYIATRDYQNGRWRFRAGQFVVITEPEFLAVLERDGMLATLHEIDGAAFMGKAKGKAPASAPEPGPADDAQEGDAVADEPAPNLTAAGGKVLGANRQHVRGEARKR